MPDDKELLAWAESKRKELLEACIAAGHDKTTLQDVAYEKLPAGNWKNPCLVFSGKNIIAKYWLSFRRLHKRSKVYSPKFNIETGEKIACQLSKS
jgi:hypothetical protein